VPESWIDAVLRSAGDAEVRVFFGHLQESGSDSSRRFKLFLSADLNSYLEISPSQVVHVERLDETDHPLGGAYVWVRSAAKLRLVGSTVVEGQADFLRGQIVKDNAAQLLATIGQTFNHPTIGTGFNCTAQSVCAPCVTYTGGCLNQLDPVTPIIRPLMRW